MPYIGFYKAWRPSLLIRDIDIVKDILVKDFQHFDRNESIINKKYDPLYAQNPFFNFGDEWRARRKELLPVLTSSKVRYFTNFESE